MNELTIKNMPKLPFDVEEAINQLRVNLSFCGDEIKTILITSSTPNEGKSFVSMNLWKMLADVGNRVLFIDADLRNSEIRTRYALSSPEKLTGVVHYLAGKVPLEDAIYSTNIANGYIMPVNNTVANPTILLESGRFKEMMETCRNSFDYIILDTPPLGSVADALNISSRVDGTVLVVRSGETPRRLVETSVRMLKRTEVPMLGIVLNRADMVGRGNYYYYNRYYNYGKYYRKYGYGYGAYGSKNRNKDQ